MNALHPARNRVPFLGLSFDPLDQAEAIRLVEAMARQGRFAYVVTPNVDHVVGFTRDPADTALHRAYEQADLVLCDSRVLQILAGWSGLELPVVTGSDLTVRLLHEVNEAGGRSIVVIGGDHALLAKLGRLYPAIAWSQHLPPMGVRRDPDARRDIADFVERTGADIVLFAIGAPQSEIVCAEIAGRGGARGVALCIGASLEFVTGAKRRAPALLQSLRLEWLFRLLSEPRRLWRRYLVEGPRIFGIWLRWRASRSPRRGAYEPSHRDPF